MGVVFCHLGALIYPTVYKVVYASDALSHGYGVGFPYILAWFSASVFVSQFWARAVKRPVMSKAQIAN